jgi:hypothetical protein
LDRWERPYAITDATPASVNAKWRRSSVAAAAPHRRNTMFDGYVTRYSRRAGGFFENPGPVANVEMGSRAGSAMYPRAPGDAGKRRRVSSDRQHRRFWRASDQQDPQRGRWLRRAFGCAQGRCDQEAADRDTDRRGVGPLATRDDDMRPVSAWCENSTDVAATMRQVVAPQKTPNVGATIWKVKFLLTR